MNRGSMELGVHRPVIEVADEGLSLERLQATVDAARECGFAVVCANDHFVFSTPWLDGADGPRRSDRAVRADGAGDDDLARRVPGPLALAKALAALDVLSGGRLIAGLGPGSSQRDYNAVGMPFEDRWRRFEEAVGILRTLLDGAPPPESTRYWPPPAVELRPVPSQHGGIPLWIASCGSPAGRRRVARLADGWLASAYNTAPARFAARRGFLDAELGRCGREGDGFPNAVATMLEGAAAWRNEVGISVSRFGGADFRAPSSHRPRDGKVRTPARRPSARRGATSPSHAVRRGG